jgi:hypothetical protein
MLATSGRWLYTQFIAVDANFKLKRKANGVQDVALAPGFAYFVASAEYKELLSDPKHLREVEVSRRAFMRRLTSLTINFLRSKAVKTISLLDTTRLRPRTPLALASMGQVLPFAADMTSFYQTVLAI